MSPRILLTGFEPFGPHDVNPSEQVVAALGLDPPRRLTLLTRILPVVYDRAFVQLRQTLEAEKPDGVILLGLGAGRADVQFERFAVNWRGAPLADNAGHRVEGEPLDPTGPAAYFSTLPLEPLTAACRAAAAPASISSHAGTFLCNEVLYRSLRWCDLEGEITRVGFVHLPSLPEQATGDDPSLPLAAQVRAIRGAVECLAALPEPHDYTQ